MAKHKKYRTGLPQKSPDAYQLIANSLTANFLDDEAYCNAVAAFLGSQHNEVFRKRFLHLYQKDRFRKLFNASANTIEQFYQNDNFHFSGLKETLTLTELIIEGHSTQINSFARARLVFETAVLQGNLELASEILENIKNENGESLWYIRNKILVLGLKGKLQEMEDFAEACNNRSKDGFVSFLIRCFLLLASDPLLHQKKLILNTIKELDEAGIKQWADLLRLFFVPRPLFEPASALTCLPAIQAFTAIDQYTLITKLSAEIFSFSDSDTLITGEFQHFTQAIKSHINDNCLPSTSLTQRNHQDNESLAIQLTKLYETEQYKTLIDTYVQNFDTLGSPLEFANLIAKAVAIANDLHISEKSGLAYQLINHLSCLYKLSAPPNQLEESIAAIIVLINHFSSSPQLQLTLYKSMPLRYDKRSCAWLAKISYLTATESTPLTHLLAENADPLREHKYITCSSSLPAHRSMRLALRESAAENGPELSTLQSNFSEVPLAKDYYESISSHYIKTNQYIQLIELCAKALAHNQNSYIAFPMTDILRFIEANTECSLNSTIIVFYYVKKIDSSKDYLLNETYEEFFSLNGASRPSELLNVLDFHDERTIVLFRDISSFETMDFLGSFNDSNDLRAERVRILDHLRDAGAIDAERHREEVDDIVMQVVVDAGATEFNVAKIDVNDTALKRTLSEDLSSLLSVFKSIKFEKEEKLIRLDSILTDGQTAKAVVAGDRNTTLLKMIHLAQNAFLYDEKYGLDKNLSTEIRHGFFSNLMRSRLEEANLLTEIDETGEYKPNIYWISANSLVAPDILQKIDTQLRWFSASFNKLITEAEEWMKVESSDEDSDRVFHYRINSREFSIFHTLAEASANGDDFFDNCITVLWEKTENCMQEMRERLNVDLKTKVDTLFEELILRITEAKHGVALMELMTSIIQIKNEIREDITTVSEWFKRNTEYAAKERSIRELIDISVECFERVRGFRLRIYKDLEILPDSAIEGRHVKAFIIALVNILENACRHSGHAQLTEITFEARETSSCRIIEISNNLCELKATAINEETISLVSDKMKGPLSLHMMRQEGGSGLSKAYNQLKTISSAFDINLALKGHRFVTEISYDSQDTNS